MKRGSLAQGARRATKGAATKTVKSRRPSGPSKTSLQEIPEIDFSHARVRRNAYAARIAKEGITVQVGRGRPRRLLEVGGTKPRSVRFPEAVWERIAKQAKRRGLTVHAALRQAVLEWLRHAA
jgi:hypothetical protein